MNQMTDSATLGNWLEAGGAVDGSWLGQARAQALIRARSLGLPGSRHSQWRHSDLSALYSHEFAQAAPGKAVSDIERHAVPGSIRVVFVDGILAPELSDLTKLPEQVSIISLSVALESAENQALFSLAGGLDEDAFALCNTAGFRDGVFIRISGKLDAPLHLLYLASGAATANYPRLLVALEPNSEATLVEDYAGESGVYFCCGVSQLHLGENSRLAHVRVQDEAKTAFHVSHCTVALSRDARYVSQVVNLGGRFSRCALDVRQQGEGAECRLDGLTWVSGRQASDMYTLVDHAQPRGRSVQLQKCIADGAAHAVYNGRVWVGVGAVATDSSQQSRNLLLSEKAKIDTEPQLEILNDDVKCRHGATVGRLDPEELFYLKSRGLDETEARTMLTYAFAAEVIDRIPVSLIASRIRKKVLERI